jgi:methionyl-tRNA formyltransferase
MKQIEDGSVHAVKQDPQAKTYYCKRYPWDRQIFWDKMTAGQVHNLVRALHGPNLPGAFTFLEGEKIVILRTKLLAPLIRGVPGRIALKQQDGVVIIAKDRGLLVTEIEIQNQILSAQNFFRICGMTLK